MIRYFIFWVCQWVLQNFLTHILDETLFQNITHIDDLSLLKDTQVALGILSLCVTCWLSSFTRIVPSSFLSLFASFNKKIM